ncbi:MAG TPA: hypothetical protein PKW95_23685 [bacterium]|nr:hypothetical protein [bacterium]
MALKETQVPERLLIEFASVRRTYFPRWRGHRDWQVRVGYRHELTDCRGECDREARIIWVAPPQLGKDDNHLRWLLIHEITHAVTRGGHGTEFVRRLERAAEKAGKVGAESLKDLLFSDIDGIRANPDTRPAQVYAMLDDWVTGTRDIPTYPAVFAELCRYFSQTPDELRRFAPRTEKVYRKAVRWRQEEEEVRRRFHSRTGSEPEPASIVDVEERVEKTSVNGGSRTFASET